MKRGLLTAWAVLAAFAAIAQSAGIQPATPETAALPPAADAAAAQPATPQTFSLPPAMPAPAPPAPVVTTSVAYQPIAPPATPPVWNQETLERFASLPVQDGGRVKPLDTFAQFTMLRINGKRSYTTATGEATVPPVRMINKMLGKTPAEPYSLTPIAWLLNIFFCPEATKSYRHFVVDAADAVTAIGVEERSTRRGRYSYNDLQPGRDRLFDLEKSYMAIPERERNRVQNQIVNLAANVHLYEELTHFMDFARARFVVTGDSDTSRAFPEAGGVSVSAILERLPAVIETLRANAKTMDEKQFQQQASGIHDLLEELDKAAENAHTVALFPPLDSKDNVWLTPGDLMIAALDVQHPQQMPVALFARFEQLAAKIGDAAGFETALSDLHRDIVASATARGDYRAVPTELKYYRGKYMFKAQWLFVVAFLFVAISWLRPSGRWIHKIVPLAVLAPTVLLCIGIAYRCIIRMRPPVTTLYETILFTVAVAVLAALVVELINRRRAAISVGAILGVVGMFIANRYEAKEGMDTMPSMVAVLDTNFWLASHVTTIVIGYAAGLLAGALAHVYILGKLIGFRKNDETFYNGYGRMVYGVICFSLLFSTIGTVLGGIWANESWGRFWGWDPKENGALMIVLWTLIVLHARRGGYIGLLGACAGGVALDMIVAFSWWGVNLLGVGLHSYGFTGGVMNSLVAFWALEALVLLAAAWVWRREKA